jgi:hypothetical protein
LFSKTKIENIFTKRIKLTSEQKQSEYYQLSCYYKGKIRLKKIEYTFELNAASFITLYNDKEVLYFGFKLRDCPKCFVLKPIVNR